MRLPQAPDDNEACPCEGTVFYALMNAHTVIPNEVRDLRKRMPQIITG